MMAKFLGRATGWWSVLAMLLLSLLLALGSIRSDLFPNSAANSVPPMEREAVPFMLLALAAGMLAVSCRAKWPRGRQVWTLVTISLGLFVAPALLIAISEAWVSAFTRVIIFSLTPVFAVVFEPHISSLALPHSRSGLLAALVAVGGALCLFPVDLPASIEATGAFAAILGAVVCLAFANCQAVRFASDLPNADVAPAAAIACVSAAIGLVATSAVTQGLVLPRAMTGFDLAWLALVTLPGLLLLFWLMRRMSAVSMTTRFVLAPWLAVLAGIAIDRPALTARMVLGLILMAAGAGWLLLAPQDPIPETELKLS
jgi:drug/metabolite transporter (DMT)-like permease